MGDEVALESNLRAQLILAFSKQDGHQFPDDDDVTQSAITDPNLMTEL